MKIIIAGSRIFTNTKTVKDAITELVNLSGIQITEVVSGGARGVDTIGEEWAKERGIPVKRFPADWDKHGRRAGPLRNIEMADYADGLLAFWDGKSAGTKHMIREAEKREMFCAVMEITLAEKCGHSQSTHMEKP